MADDVIDTPMIETVLSLDTARDAESGETALMLTLRFQSGTIARLPISEEQGMRLWALLDRLRQDKGWSAPATPVSVDKVQ